MTLKRNQTITFFLVFFLLRNSTGFATTTHVPTNVKLRADLNPISVTWSGNLTHDDGYHVYWGIASGNLNQSVKITDKHTRTYTINGLNSGTTYYVAVSSYNNGVESAKSTVASITTAADTTPPAVPTGFWIVPGTNITETTVGLVWNVNTETDLDHYTIYYGTASGSNDMTLTVAATDGASAVITGLTPAIRYYFVISATDTNGNESGKSSTLAPELIIDTLPDTLPPNAPDGLTAVLSGANEVTVTVTPGNTGMVDYAGIRVYYSTTSGNLDQSVDLGADTLTAFTGLQDGSTWYYAATIYDLNNNESGQCSEVSIVVEKTVSFLNSSNFKGGCFISALSGR